MPRLTVTQKDRDTLDLLFAYRGAEKAFKRLHAETGEDRYLEMLSLCTARQEALQAELRREAAA